MIRHIPLLSTLIIFSGHAAAASFDGWSTSFTYPGSNCNPEYETDASAFDFGYARMNSKVDGLKVNCPLDVMYPTPRSLQNGDWEDSGMEMHATVRFRNNSDEQKRFRCNLTVRGDNGQVLAQTRTTVNLTAKQKVWEDLLVRWPPENDGIGEMVYLYCALPQHTSIQSIHTHQNRSA